MSQIQVKNLVRSFRRIKGNTAMPSSLKNIFWRKYETNYALNNVSFSINRGELVGYIGPNGAGKSTTVKILSDILVPNFGTCLVNNKIPWKQRKEHVKKIGVVFGQRTQLWWDLPVIESLKLLKSIYGLADDAFCSEKEELVTMLDLAPLLDVPVRQLSLGQRMRCDIAAALAGAMTNLFWGFMKIMIFKAFYILYNIAKKVF